MINILGVVSVVIFYILILAVGMWAARKNSGVEGDQEVNYKKNQKERKRIKGERRKEEIKGKKKEREKERL